MLFNVTFLMISVSCVLISHYIYTLMFTLQLSVKWLVIIILLLLSFSPSQIMPISGLSHSCNDFYMNKNKLVLFKCLHVLRSLLFTVMIRKYWIQDSESYVVDLITRTFTYHIYNLLACKSSFWVFKKWLYVANESEVRAQAVLVKYSNN